MGQRVGDLTNESFGIIRGMFSPLTQKRFKAFRRIRRAWWSLIALGVLFVFCLLADFVCPHAPDAVINPATLEHYRTPATEFFYDIRTARWSRADDGTIFDFEGPEEVKRLVVAGTVPTRVETTVGITDYDVRTTTRAGYTRYFLTPKTPPAVTTETKPPLPIAYPFRPCKEHPFGIDANGFDVYSRVVYGLRLSLIFGLVLAFSGMLIGLVIGSIEGYFGGLVDILGQRLTEIWSAMPFLYVMIFIGSALGQGLSDFQRFLLLLFCYAIFNWIAVSYYMRAEFLRLRSRTFVEAAKCQGFSATRIIFGHILPNALTPLITLFPFLLMGAIGSLAALDFLGFGLPPMAPSCGELLRQAQATPSAWWLILFPSLALFIVMLLTVLIGEGLRDAFDPRQKSHLE